MVCFSCRAQFVNGIWAAKLARKSIRIIIIIIIIISSSSSSSSRSSSSSSSSSRLVPKEVREHHDHEQAHKTEYYFIML
jgi:uncharacterized protein YpmB